MTIMPERKRFELSGWRKALYVTLAISILALAACGTVESSPAPTMVVDIQPQGMVEHISNEDQLERDYGLERLTGEEVVVVDDFMEYLGVPEAKRQGIISHFWTGTQAAVTKVCSLLNPYTSATEIDPHIAGCAETIVGDSLEVTHVAIMSKPEGEMTRSYKDGLVHETVHAVFKAGLGERDPDDFGVYAFRDPGDINRCFIVNDSGSIKEVTFNPGEDAGGEYESMVPVLWSWAPEVLDELVLHAYATQLGQKQISDSYGLNYRSETFRLVLESLIYDQAMLGRFNQAAVTSYDPLKTIELLGTAYHNSLQRNAEDLSDEARNLTAGLVSAYDIGLAVLGRMNGDVQHYMEEYGLADPPDLSARGIPVIVRAERAVSSGDRLLDMCQNFGEMR